MDIITNFIENGFCNQSNGNMNDLNIKILTVFMDCKYFENEKVMKLNGNAINCKYYELNKKWITAHI